MEAKYKRVMLKISGEALAGDDHFGINEDMLKKVALQVKADGRTGCCSSGRRKLLERQDQQKHGQSNS